MSDHSLIVTSFDVSSEHVAHSLTVTRRHWRSFNFDDFVADLQQSSLVRCPPSDVAELFDMYDDTSSVYNWLVHLAGPAPYWLLHLPGPAP